MHKIGFKAVGLALQSLGVHEEAPNWGKWIAVYLKCVGILFPAPWCAAFVAYKIHQAAGVLEVKASWPKTGSVQAAVNWATKRGLDSRKPEAGCAFAIYFPSLRRYAHIGLIVKVNPDGSIVTVEGNSNDDGSREGTKVVSKVRKWTSTFVCLEVR